MTLPRYARYKHRGADWLGDIPAEWNTKPLWTLFRRVKRVGYQGEQLLSVYRDFGVIPKSSRDDNNNKPSEDLSTYQLVRPGDMAINKMKAWQGSVGISEHRGIVSPAYFVYEARHCECPRFLHYLLRSPRYVAGYLSISKGIRVNQWDLEPEYHSRMPVVLPSREEQFSIAAFLDCETGKIDALIAEQEKLIALLAEKRQATISHAVIRGLNPDAPMKDSGVAWLGEVPAHWAVGKCGFYLTILSGYAFPSSGFSTDESDTKLLRGINVGVSVIRWTETVYWKRTPNDGLDPYELHKGDLVIGMDRPLISEGMRVAVVQATDLPCLLLQRVAKLQTGPLLARDFLIRLLSSEMFVAHFSPDTTGVSVPHISPEQIANFVIPIPPFGEQEEIAAFLIAETRKLDALRSQAERSIVLLKERRSALITAAVTGQIDVRGEVQAPAAEPAVAFA